MKDVKEESVYVSPLVSRWATAEMIENFSELRRFRLWRQIWIALAEAERDLGLPITAEQTAEMRAHADDVDLELARRFERETRHDVMAHVRAFGEQCPTARPIIHLGATSCDVTDNADLALMRDGLMLLQKRLAAVIMAMAGFAARQRNLACLGSTHFQPAQLTTVGRRACLWLQDFATDFVELERLLAEMPFRGIKGTTGAQASFMDLFDGDQSKVKRLDEMVTRAMGFSVALPVTGQTYSRKLDSRILDTLSQLAQSAHKFANDVRLLQGLGELEEPFAEAQVGSSAMPWKRNPMRSERLSGLARFVICAAQNAAHTAATQWLERSLDDSSNRRLSLAESFLATDAVLNICANVAGGLVVYPAVIARRLAESLPFMASEMVMMAAVRAGGDRQELHEKLRRHAHAAAARMKREGASCDLMERIAADPAFAAVKGRLGELVDPSQFLGRAREQVDEFLRDVVGPIRAKCEARGITGGVADLRV